jgi:hypothetical protein
MAEEEYKNILRELAGIKKNQWPEESQERLLDTLIEMGTLMNQQTQVIEKQAKLLIRIEGYLGEEEEPEPEPLVC